jgi:hypothetical protein
MVSEFKALKKRFATPRRTRLIEGGDALVAVAKGAVAVLDMHPGEGRGTLLALVPPEAAQRP